MRLALVIVALAGIAVGLVHIRRAEMSVRHEIQCLRLQQISLRRRLWDQQVRLGEIMAPARVRLLAKRLGMVMPGEMPLYVELADRGGVERPWDE